MLDDIHDFGKRRETVKANRIPHEEYFDFEQLRVSICLLIWTNFHQKWTSESMCAKKCPKFESLIAVLDAQIYDE